jgi:hypothetical protein
MNMIGAVMRTRLSFELAAKRLGADVANVAASSRSVMKGESPRGRHPGQPRGALDGVEVVEVAVIQHDLDYRERDGLVRDPVA